VHAAGEHHTVEPVRAARRQVVVDVVGTPRPPMLAGGGAKTGRFRRNRKQSAT
jgi:hypothetical protein